jgi:hypothetical protein
LLQAEDGATNNCWLMKEGFKVSRRQNFRSYECRKFARKSPQGSATSTKDTSIGPMGSFCLFGLPVNDMSFSGPHFAIDGLISIYHGKGIPGSRFPFIKRI